VTTAAERRRQVIIAGHRGVRDSIERFVEDEDPGVRAGALSALHRAGLLTLDHLLAGATDPAAEVRRRSATMAGTTQADDIGNVLVILLADSEGAVVEVACWAAGERPLDEATLPLLISIATGHDDPLCRESAIAALGAIGDDRGLPAILTGCSDKPAVRRRAVLALAPFDGPEVETAMTTALEDRDWQVRQAAEDLL